MDQKLKEEILSYEDIVDTLEPGIKKTLLKLLEERKAAKEAQELEIARNKLLTYKPYPKQIEFHELGSKYLEGLFIAGNQLGKSYSGAAEMAYHLTGLYPDWWNGRRFDKPVRAIVGSNSYDVLIQGAQRLLVGDPEDDTKIGTGYVPHSTIVSHTAKEGVKFALRALVVKHVSGGNSVLKFLSYDQGRTKWQADTVDLVWFDEEPPEDIYMEGITRTNVRKGYAYMTFTPLFGMSAVVKRFYPRPTPGMNGNFVQMGIMDVGHYTEDEKRAIIAKYPIHERDARSFGIPIFGSGMVFPIDIEAVIIPPIEVPKHWAILGGIDFGWDHPTAVVKIAWDRDSDVIYVINCFRERQKTPIIVATAIKGWGDMEVAFPHDGLQHDKGSGTQLAEIYKNAGIRMLHQNATFENGSNSVEAGILEMLERFTTGRLKIFSTCTDLINEIRQYHRKEGIIVKEDDDAISALRYAIMMKRFARAPKTLEKQFVKDYYKEIRMNARTGRARA